MRARKEVSAAEHVKATCSGGYGLCVCVIALKLIRFFFSQHIWNPQLLINFTLFKVFQVKI